MENLGCAVLVLVSFLGFSQAAIFNNDPRYGNWQKLFPTDPYTRIPTYIDEQRYQAAGDTTSPGIIRSALTQMNLDLNGCIQFMLITSPNSVGRDFLWISPAYNNNTISSTCASVPGRVVNQNGNGQKLLLVAAGTTSVLSGCTATIRSVMRYLAHTLGQRNEYQRVDRPITVTATNVATNLQSFNMYNTYTAATVTYPGAPAFDYNSITMVATTDNAAASTSPVWSGTAAAGTLNRLSGADCSGIAWKYGCGGYCQDPYIG